MSRANTESQETTGAWAGSPVPTKGYTNKHRKSGEQWGARKVRADGTVKWKGRYYQPRPDAQVRPIPGEYLLFYDYDDAWEEPRGRFTIMEWSSPPDPDSYIRREVWLWVGAPEEVVQAHMRSPFQLQDGAMFVASLEAGTS